MRYRQGHGNILRCVFRTVSTSLQHVIIKLIWFCALLLTSKDACVIHCVILLLNNALCSWNVRNELIDFFVVRYSCLFQFNNRKTIVIGILDCYDCTISLLHYLLYYIWQLSNLNKNDSITIWQLSKVGTETVTTMKIKGPANVNVNNTWKKMLKVHQLL